MRIGIISNSDYCIPLIHTLVGQRLQVYLFYTPSADVYVNQKVQAFAAGMQVDITTENREKENLYTWINQVKPDFAFILGYNQLIDIKRVNGLSGKLFNIHFGALPSNKGPSPIFWQLKSGVLQLALAIHHLTAKFDDGPVVWSKQVDNQPHLNYQAVGQLFSQLCVEGVFYILNTLLSGRQLPVVSSKSSASKYYKRPQLQDIVVDWDQMPAQAICNLVRACNPWNKGALTFFNGMEVKIMDAMLEDDETEANNSAMQPGTILAVAEQLSVLCADGKAIRINMLFCNDFYMPAYQAAQWGLMQGSKFHNLATAAITK